MQEQVLHKKSIGWESVVFMGIMVLFFAVLGTQMGSVNMINTLLNTAYDLLLSTIFYIMAIAVLMGALSELLSEFGVVAVANKLLSPLMKPLYGLPGAGVLGIFSTYLSDNPAVLTLAENKNFRGYFKVYQLPALCNLGTAFGMGLIVTTFMMGIPSPTGENLIAAALIGNLGAVVGSVVSARLMLMFTARIFGKEAGCATGGEGGFDVLKFRKVREGSPPSRFLEALLDGGKTGVGMGLSIIPGVLIICTLVLTLTNGPSAMGYTGGAYEGVALLPFLGEKISFILEPLFGFSSPECLAVPVTSLGAAGAAISLVPQMVADGVAKAGDVAVFTAMCMCWSGYLSTHVAMMESLGHRKLTGKAIFSHTVGGLAAGVSANLLFKLFTLVFYSV